jgi:hypothetical protein
MRTPGSNWGEIPSNSYESSALPLSHSGVANALYAWQFRCCGEQKWAPGLAMIVDESQLNEQGFAQIQGVLSAPQVQALQEKMQQQLQILHAREQIKP